MGQNQIEANEVIRKLEKTVTVFSKRDRKGLLIKAAAPVRKTLRNNTKFRDRSARVNIVRGREYRPGNLKKSMKRLAKIKRSSSVFVGPVFGRSEKYDGYYWAMAYGNGNNYRRELLIPSAKQSEAASIRAFKKDFAKRFGTRAAQQKLNVR